MPASIGKYPLPLKLLIIGRASVAVTSIFTPRLFARRFRIQTAGTPTVFLGRMLGIRNAALALGLIELKFLAAPRAYLGLSVAIDLADTVSLITAGRRREMAESTVRLGTSAALTAAAYGTATLLMLPERGSQRVPTDYTLISDIPRR
jgi:hypothetical protein